MNGDTHDTTFASSTILQRANDKSGAHVNCHDIPPHSSSIYIQKSAFKSYSLSFKKEFPKIFFRDKIIDAEDKSVPSFYLEILFDTFQAWKFYNIFSTKTRRVAETLLDIAESLFSILQNQISSLKQCLSEFVT